MNCMYSCKYSSFLTTLFCNIWRRTNIHIYEGGPKSSRPLAVIVIVGESFLIIYNH